MRNATKTLISEIIVGAIFGVVVVGLISIPAVVVYHSYTTPVTPSSEIVRRQHVLDSIIPPPADIFGHKSDISSAAHGFFNLDRGGMAILPRSPWIPDCPVEFVLWALILIVIAVAVISSVHGRRRADRF